MKKIIILSILIYGIICSFDSCANCNDQSQCFNINIEFEGFSCHKYENEAKSNECVPFPNDKKEQEALYNMDINNAKELLSSGLYTSSLDKLVLYYPDKKSFDKDETIKTKKHNLSPTDKEIMTSKNTCLYQLYGRYLDNYNKNGANYPNVKDKNLCFNSDKFDEALNLIDCGFAEIKFPLNDKTFTMNTCFPFPNRKMPENIQNIFNKWVIESQIIIIKQEARSILKKERLEIGEIFEKSKGIMSLMKIDDTSNNSDETSGNEIRKLQSTNAGVYEIVIENQYGKKYKYTNNVQDKPIVINEGNIEEEDKSEDIQRINNSKYYKLNMLFSLFLILLL